MSVGAAGRSAGVQSTCVGAANHAIHFCFSFTGSIQTLTADMSAKDNGQVFLAVHVIGVEMQEHLGAIDRGYTRAHNALHVR